MHFHYDITFTLSPYWIIYFLLLVNQNVCVNEQFTAVIIYLITGYLDVTIVCY